MDASRLAVASWVENGRGAPEGEIRWIGFAMPLQVLEGAHDVFQKAVQLFGITPSCMGFAMGSIDGSKTSAFEKRAIRHAVLSLYSFCGSVIEKTCEHAWAAAAAGFLLTSLTVRIDVYVSPFRSNRLSLLGRSFKRLIAGRLRYIATRNGWRIVWRPTFNKSDWLSSGWPSLDRSSPNVTAHLY